MNLDLSNRDHVAELLAACESFPAYKVTSTPETGRIRSAACKALSSPAAAELIRQLVERGGSGVDVKCVRGIQWRIVYYAKNEREWFAVNDADGNVLATIPALIARLLALAPNAGAEAVLQALGGET